MVIPVVAGDAFSYETCITQLYLVMSPKSRTENHTELEEGYRSLLFSFCQCTIFALVLSKGFKPDIGLARTKSDPENTEYFL